MLLRILVIWVCHYFAVELLICNGFYCQTFNVEHVCLLLDGGWTCSALNVICI
jgi:hypothetical protein